MKRLTAERVNGIKQGYWSPAKKEDLVQRLAAYENTGLEPEEVAKLNDFEKSQTGILIEKLNEEKRKHSWIPVEERLPEDGTYLCTFLGELVGQEEPFTGMRGIENGIWDEPDCVIAWQPLPDPYHPEEAEDDT